MRTALPYNTWLPIILGLAAAACTDRAGPAGAGSPAVVGIISGNAQTGIVAQELPDPLVVRVTDALGQSLAGVLVRFEVAASSGQVRDIQVRTDVQGIARGYWTLGTKARVPQRVDAIVKVNGEPLLATFSATGTPDVLSQLVKHSGDGQMGPLGLALAESLTVVAADRFDNGIAGITVSWTVSSGGGAVTARSTATDTLGLVRAAWILGARLDLPQVVMVSSDGLPGAMFSATAQLPANAIISAFEGNDQRDTVGKAVAESLAVRVTLSDQTPIEGATIQWAVTAGGGGVSPGISTTDRDGVARAGWTIGTLVGENRATATVAPLAPVSFAATGIADAPATITKVSGDDQHGAPGYRANDSLVAVVTDLYGNPVPSVIVTFAVSVGDGAVSPEQVTTDVAGRAATAFRLGGQGTENAVSVTVGHAPPVAFTATGTPGGDWTFAVAAGDGQSALTKGVVTGLEVRLADGRGRPVEGFTVAWSASDEGQPAAAASRTDANGIAANSWTLGCPASQTMKAAVQNLAPVTFTATAGRRPAYLASFRFPPTSTPLYAYSTRDFRVTVRDQRGCPVSGVETPWSLSSMVPNVAPWPVGMKVEAIGRAQSDSLGHIEYRLTYGGLIRAVLCARLPASLTPFESDSTGGFCTIAQANVTSLGILPWDTVIPRPGDSVRLQAIAADAQGRRIWGAQLRWRALNPTIAVLAGSAWGESAVIRGIQYGTASVVVENVVQGAPSPWPTATATVRVRELPGPPAMISGGSDVVGSIGERRHLAVYVGDTRGVAVPGAVVSWSLESGNGSFDSTSTVSDSLGRAITTFIPGVRSGSNVVRASLSGVGSVSILVWTPHSNPVRIVVRAGDNTTGFVGHPLPDSISVRVEDTYGNGAYNEEVVFAVLSGAGHVERTKLRTDTLGIASTRWTPGTVGTNTATATWKGQSVTFHSTGTTAGGLGIVMPNGGEQSLGGPTQGAIQLFPTLVVRVIDDQGTPVAGATVTWPNSVTTVTDAQGITSHAPSVWIGPAAVQTFTASVAGGAQAVFAVVTIPSIAATQCGPHAPSPTRVSTRILAVATCFSRQGAPFTGATFMVTGPFQQGYGGGLAPVPGYRRPGEYHFYWFVPGTPGTYYFWAMGAGIPSSAGVVVTP